MSTRSRIGILLPDDSILSVYHHWDGYPEWLGVTLEEHFNTYEKASELIDGGNMGCCYSDSEYDAETGEYIDVEPRATYYGGCLLYTSPSPRDRQKSRMPSSA